MFSNILKEKEVKKFIIIFYIIGTIGFILPITGDIFKLLIPYALILNFFLLAYFYRTSKIQKSIIIFGIIYISGLVIEIIGVQTKIIFGDYTYGAGLGIKIFGTPLLIGLNWLFLSFTTTSVVDKFKINTVFKIITASVFMLLYDIILEQIAPKLDMWSWKNDVVPIQNYMVWFGLALIFNSLLKIFKIETKNPLALIIFVCQTIFFILLFIYFQIFA